MELIPYSGGGILEPSIDQVNEFVPNPQSCWITKLESGDVEFNGSLSRRGRRSA